MDSETAKTMDGLTAQEVMLTELIGSLVKARDGIQEQIDAMVKRREENRTEQLRVMTQAVDMKEAGK